MHEIGQLLVRLLFDDDDFEKGLKAAQPKLQAATQALDGVANAVNDRVTQAFKAGTIAVAGFVAASIAIGANFDREIRTVGAILGEGVEGFEKAEQAARDLGATTQFSATQAASALQNFARAGFTAEESVAAAGPALSLATAAVADLDLATSSVAATLAQFRLETEESARVADVLANATVSTKFGLAGLTDALKTAGPAGAAAGLSLEQTVAAVSQFRNLGLQAATSGIAFRSVITKLVAPSGRAKKAIEDLGLALEDVDPTKVGFDKALITLREAGLGVREATEIFGRFGLQISGVVETVDDADKGFAALASTFETEIGKAAQVAEEASANVLTQFQLLASATQEVFLSVFTSIREPLLTVLGAVNDVVTEISKRFNDSAGEITGSAQDIADAIAEFLGDNAAAIADGFVSLAKGVVGVTKAIGPLLAVLNRLSPLMSALFSILAENLNVVVIVAGISAIAARLVLLQTAAVRAANGVLLLASHLGVDLAGGITKAAGAIRGFAVALTTSTGGLFAIAVAIGVVVAGLVELISRTRDAAEAQRLLSAAREASVQETAAQAAEQEHLGEILEKEQARAQELLKANQDLSNERRNELRQITSLTAANLQQAIAAGKIVEVGGQLQFVTTAVRELGEEGIAFLEDTARAAAREAGNIGAIIDPLEKKVAELGEIDAFGGSTELAEAAARDIEAILASAGDSVRDLGFIEGKAIERAERDGISLIQALQTEAKVAAERARIRQENAAEQAANLANSTARIVSVAQEEQTRTVEQETAKRIAEGRKQAEAAGEDADAAIKAAERAAKEIARILAQARSEEAGFLPKPTQVQQELDQQLAAIEQFAEQVRVAFDGSEAERTAVLNQAVQARALLIANANREVADLARAANAEAANLARQRVALVNEFVRGGISEEERIRQNGQRRILQLEAQFTKETVAVREAILASVGADATEEQRAQAVQDANAAIIKLEKQLGSDRNRIQRATTTKAAKAEQDRVDAFQDDVDQIIADLDRLSRETAEAVLGESGPFGRLGEAVRQSIIGAVEAGLREFPKLTRAILDIGKAVETIGNAVNGLVGGLTEFGGELVGIFDKISGGFVSGFDPASIVSDIAGAVADAEQTLADARADLAGAETAEEVEEAAAAVQDAAAALQAAKEASASGEAGRVIVDQLVDGAIDFAETLAKSLDGILNQLVERLPELIEAVVESLSSVLTTLAEELPNIITTLVDGIDDFVRVLAEKLPDIVLAVVESIGPAVESLIEGITVLLESLLESLPQIVDSLLKQIPQIINSLAVAIPRIVQGLVDAIPGILQAIIDNIDDILIAIFEAIPAIVQSVVDAVPAIIQSVVEALPDLIDAILSSIPTLITEILTLVPELIASLVQSIPDLILAVIEAIPFIIDALIENIPTIVVALVEGIISAVPQILGSILELYFVRVPEIAVALVKAIFIEIPVRLINAASQFVNSVFEEFLPNLVASAKAWVNQVFTDFVPNLIESAKQAVKDAVKKMGEGFEDIAENFGQIVLDILTLGIASAGKKDAEDRKGLGKVTGALGDAVSSLGRAIGSLFGGGGNSAQGGVSFAKRTARTIIHPGEAILDAATNRNRLFPTTAANRTSPIGPANFPSGAANGGMLPFELRVSIGDRDLDRYTVEADGRGGLGLTNKSNRRKTGTRVGFTRRTK